MTLNAAALLIEQQESTQLQTIVSRCLPRHARVSSADQATSVLASQSPDVIVLDLDLDPLGSLRLLSNESLRRYPFVVVSGTISTALAFRLGQLGVRAFVSKPVTEQELVEAIKTALETPPDYTPHLRATLGFQSIQEIERNVRQTMLLEALARSGGSKTGAARLLKVSRQLLQHMMRGQKRFS